jgi:hypothetical protein
MTPDVRQSEIHEIIERHAVHYEVRPYYVVSGRYPDNAEPIEQRVQAGFTVDLYTAMEKCEFPVFQTDQARQVVDYFECLAHEVQSTAGNGCKVDVIPYEDSVVLDTQNKLQPQGMLQIRISHDRGLDQPEGPAEEQALGAIRDALHQLGIREK